MYTLHSTNVKMVRQIQEFLKIPVDGNFGPKTAMAVVKYQRDNFLVADGIVGNATLEHMGILDTDLKNQLHFKTPNGLTINKAHLPEGEFIREKYIFQNEYLVLHHTAGWHNPYNTVRQWGNDTRGRIATEFVVGGSSIKGDDNAYDGEVVQAFPEGCQGWHIGPSGSRFMNRHSVGIEMCNFGQLTEAGKSYIGTQADLSQIYKFAEPFKNYSKFHKYSAKQINTLRELILYIANRDSIDIRDGLIKWINKGDVAAAFSYQQDAHDGKVKGLLVHGNIRKDKIDIFPQEELVEMLLNL